MMEKIIKIVNRLVRSQGAMELYQNKKALRKVNKLKLKIFKE